MPAAIHRLPTWLAATESLLRLRFGVAWQAVTRKPAAQTATAVALLLVLPAALQMGSRAAKAMATGNRDADAIVTGTFLLLLVLQVLLLLAGNGGAGGVAEPLPSKVTQVLPIPFGTTLAADAVSFLVSLPTLFLIAASLPLATMFGVLTVIPILLLGLLGIALSLLLTRLGTILQKRLGAYSAVMAALVVGVGLLMTLPSSAVASVVHSEDKVNRLPWEVPPAPVHVPAALRYAPPGLAATVVRRDATPGARALSLFLLAGIVAVAGTGTIALERWADILEPRSASVRTRAPGAARSSGAFATELRLLLRNPAAHLPLRSPASLLLMLGYAWIAPNLGPDAVSNLVDLLGIGATLYALLWQTQLVCNRFGSDAGTAAMLFSLPASRARMLAVKNAALGIALFAIDGSVVSTFATIAGNPRLIPTLIFALPSILLIFTALGNVVSLVSPFAIARRAERKEREPERSLLFVYALVIGGTALLFVPVQRAVAHWGAIGFGAGIVYATALYAASVGVARLLLDPVRERRLIAALDGTK